MESSYNFPEALGTIPFGINNSDIITGFYITTTGRKGFVSDLAGALTRSVEFPGATETQLFALSDLSIVGGGWYGADGQVSPFLYDIATEAFTSPPKPTAEGNYVATSVNESGEEFGTALEVFPPGSELFPGRGASQCNFHHNSAHTGFATTHAAVSVKRSQEKVLALAQREGWRALELSRGSFRVIESWIENRVMLKVLTVEMAAECLAATRARRSDTDL